MDTINGEVNRTARNVSGSINYNGRIQTDPTLTIANMAADAKATGDAIKDIEASIADVESSITSIEGDITSIEGSIEEVESSISKTVSDTLNPHIENKSNPHGVTKAQVGLDKVDNTSDMEKPVSNLQADAIDNVLIEAAALATSAQNAADNAQATANEAKTTANNALPKSGGDMTGNLSAPSLSINKDSWATLLFKDSSGKNMGRVAIDTSSNRMILGQQETGASYYEGYQLPARTNGLTGSKFYEILTTKNVAFTSGNATIDSTNVSSKTELAYYKYGRIVFVAFDFTTSATPNKTFTEYQMATGLPKPSACSKHQASVTKSNASRSDGIAWVTSSGALRIKSRDLSMESANIVGTIAYIAES